jgi:hypothetical protein
MPLVEPVTMAARPLRGLKAPGFSPGSVAVIGMVHLLVCCRQDRLLPRLEEMPIGYEDDADRL